MKYLNLNDGNKIPMMGIGTFLLTPDEAENSVYNALKDGYSLIDTANAYVNEKAVGRGIRRAIEEGIVTREEVYLETKIWPSFYEDESAVDKTLERLGVDYIDMLILHQPAGNYVAGYKMLEKAKKEGKVKSIGISNFTIEQMEDLLSQTEIVPSLTQVEAHPYFPQTELKKYLDEKGIVLQAWYPLGGKGNDSVLSEEVFARIGEKYSKTPAQAILRWHIDSNNIVIPGSRNEEHIRQNIDIFDFELTDEDMAEIAKIQKPAPFYNQTQDKLDGYAMWRPDVDGQK